MNYVPLPPFATIVTQIETRLPKNLKDNELDTEFLTRLETYFKRENLPYEIKFARLSSNNPKVQIAHTPFDRYLYTLVKRNGKWLKT